MKNYDDMSDLEVNGMVGKIIFKLEGKSFRTTNPMNNVIEFISGFGDEREFRYFDGCNKPADAWPIIVGNNISISHCISLYRADTLVYDKSFDNGFKIFKQDSKPGDTSSNGALRAAMICFLKMNDERQS